MRTASRSVSHPFVYTAALPASTAPLIGVRHSQLSFRPIRLACLMAATNGVAANGSAVLEKAVEHLSLQQDTSPLFQPIQVGRHQLSTRLCYCPLTRMRAVIENQIQPQAAEYYSQRTEAGVLLISEATVVEPRGLGYPCVPGIWTQAQTEAWKPIVKAVHDKGGIFFLQLWHTGRVSHSAYHNGAAPISSSDTPLAERFTAYLPTGEVAAHTPPTAMTKAEIAEAVEAYAHSARNAIEAGFDGVEIHGANGYLLDQFLKDSINKRTDEYGGSIENRARFSLEVTQAVVDAVGADKVGHRLSPYAPFNDALDSDPVPLCTYVASKLSDMGLAYLHCITARIGEKNDDVDCHDWQSLAPFRKAFKGPFIAAGGFTPQSALKEVASGATDIVAIGRWWLANPDFLERVRQGAPLNKYDRSTFYTQDQKVGYTDYPFLHELPKAAKTEKHYSGVTVYA